MRIKILVPSALIDQKTGKSAGLYEMVNAPADRAKYLVSIGAAETVEAHEEQKAEGAPQGHPDPADGATTNRGANPSTGTPNARPQSGAAQPPRRPAPKAK